MGLLKAWDLAIVVLYLLAITSIGLWFYRKNTGLQEYLLGSKRMQWFPVALSILAADASAVSYLGVPAWSFQHDLKLNQQIFSCLVAVPIVIWLFLPIYSKANIYTAYQYLETRFDLRVRLIASVFFLVLRGAHVAIVIYAPALMMSELMSVPLKFSILVMGLLTAFYTTMGGIRAVIWTDAIQVFTVLIGFATVTLSVLNHIPGGMQEVWRVGSAAGKFQLFDFSWRLDQIDNFWALLIGGTVLNIQAMSTDQAVLQKFFTTRSAKETAKSLIFYGIVLMPLITMLSVLGVLLFVLYSSRPELRASLQNADAIVPHYAARLLPTGLSGLVVASIFAGSMSTVSASLNSLATSSVVDIYRRLLQRERSDQHYAQVSRWATLLWGLLATLGALYAGALGALMLAFTRIQSLVGGMILGIFILAVATPCVTGSGALAGAAIGSLFVAYCAIYAKVSLFWFCVLGCVATVAGGWLCAKLLFSAKGKAEPPIAHGTQE
jgi:SSS family solute:Na+ symporter